MTGSAEWVQQGRPNEVLHRTGHALSGISRTDVFSRVSRPLRDVVGRQEAVLDELNGFVLEMARGLYHPVGSVSLDEAVAGVRAAIAVARSNQARDLLVDITALTGFSSPSTFQRFLAIVEWAEEAQGRLRLAMVAREEVI